MKKSVFSPLLGTQLLGASLLALPLAWTGAARAQDAPKPRTIYLYNASLGNVPAGINAARSGPWGNGSVSNARRVEYEGAPTLQLQTRNLQEGARFDFTNPVDIEAYRATGFLRLRLRFREGGFGGFPGGGGFGGGGGGFPGGGGGFPGGGGGFQGGGGGFGGDGGGGGGRGGGRGRGRGDNFLMEPRWESNAQFQGALPPFGGGPPGGFPGGFPGGPPGEGQPDGAPAVARQFTNIKEIAVTLLRENGATAGRFTVDLNNQTPDEQGWRLFVLPIKNMTSTPGASGRVTRAIFTSDVEDTFYMAQAALVIESGDMTVSIRRPDDAPGAGPAEIEVKPGRISLIADVEAGAADPIVEWNFDADNVGNLPPGALNVPAIPLGGPEGFAGDGLPGGGFPGAPQGFPGAPQGAFPGGAPGAGGIAGAGPRLDARGLTTSFEYPNEEQNYRVEVTVRDRSGVKTPVTSSILVKVRG